MLRSIAYGFANIETAERPIPAHVVLDDEDDDDGSASSGGGGGVSWRRTEGDGPILKLNSCLTGDYDNIYFYAMIILDIVRFKLLLHLLHLNSNDNNVVPK